MNITAVKSLKIYIEECISEFDFKDFSPPISHHDLALKFARILHKENAYWEEAKTEDKWNRWIFIQFKTFANLLHPSILGLNFTNNKITFSLTKEISDFELRNKNNRTEISIFDIWLDHSKLVQTLYALVKKGIDESNVVSS